MLQLGYIPSMRPTDQMTAPQLAKNVVTSKPTAKRAWQPPVLNRLSVVDTTLSPKTVPSNDASLMDS